jgi:DNA-binding Lrp family transcriptional regulator
MNVRQTLFLDHIDRLLVRATQGGLPLSARPYHRLAQELGLEPAQVMLRLQRMLDAGAIRRIGVVPNHHALGWRANGMSVWNVEDRQVDRTGVQVGALDFVSHCYRRPRRLPQWPYNLFAMVHGRDRDEVQAKVQQIEQVLGDASHGHEVLYSSAILKKAGLRLA